MIQMMIKETIFDSTVNEKIKERYDDVIGQYSKMASLYECKISDIMDTYGTS